MIYLDAGATTLEKPGLRARGDGPRGADDDLARPRRHSAVRLAEQTAFRCRSEAAALFGAARPEQVIFTQNATHGAEHRDPDTRAPGEPGRDLGL